MRREVFALCLLAGAAMAAVSPDVAPYLRAAASLYQSLDFERALEQVHRAKTVAHGAEDDREIDLYEGIILADLSRTDEARSAFEAALGIDPAAALPIKVAPKVSELFEQTRAEVKKHLQNNPVQVAPVAPAPAPAVPATAPASVVHTSITIWAYRGIVACGAVAILAGGSALAVPPLQSSHPDWFPGITHSDVQLIRGLGWGALGVGVVGVGIGAYLLARAPDDVSVAVGPAGLSVMGRF